MMAAAGNPPLFSTGIAQTDKGELLFTQKNLKRLDVFSRDGSSLLRSISLEDEPTGLTVDDAKAYVTTFKKAGKLQIVSLESAKVEASVPVGSGACYPLLSADKKK
ncbi:MAG TPA: YVTN family beta-propeller repeat-containing protein, partial [Porphyromonadaceae bacterium]|nr:YVTN family beta-propeller repeat-containing protein [Porphyromonadaceae bacterium]